jgi:GT2 family glycosyltransferase
LAANAKYPYLLLINNDTKTLNLSNTIRLIIDHKLAKHVIASCKIINPDSTRQQNIYAYPKFYKLALELFLLKPLLWKILDKKRKKTQGSFDLAQCYFSGCFLLLSKELFLGNKGFDERFIFYHEEADFFYRLRNKAQKLIIDDEIIHYGGGGKDMSGFAFINYYVGLFKLFLFNRISNPILLRIVFKFAFSIRILLLSIGLNINFTPLVAYSRRENTKTKKEIIGMHKEVLRQISDL